MAKHIFSAIDIGSESVKVVVGEFYNKQFNILAASEAKTRGVKRGVIVDIEQASASIRLAIDQCEELLGIKISSVVVGIPGVNASLYFVEGFTPITSDDHVVRGDDVLRAINSAAIKKQLLHSEIVNVIPLEFELDDHKNIQNPKKMVGKKLGVKAVIVAAPKELVIQTVLAVEKAGINVLDIVTTPIADANQVLNQAESEMYGTVINIGYENTNIVVYENNKIRGLITRNIGTENVVNDIAFIYKIDVSDARMILRQYGVLKESLASKEVMIETNTVEGKEVVFTQYDLFEIIEARMVEILNLSYDEIQKITENKPLSIVMSGGSLNIDGYEAVVNKVFGNVGRLADYNLIGARDPKYSTAIGLIKTIYKKQVLRGKLKLSLSAKAEEELVTFKKKSIQIDEDSVLGKVFGFFFE